MSNALPFRTAVEHTPDDRAVIDLTGPTSTAVFEALGCGTARAIFASLSDEPATPSDLADRIDTSLQNVQYHLGRLVDADLVEGVDTWYSSKGREMTVYAANADRLVVRCGSAEPDEMVQPAATAAD